MKRAKLLLCCALAICKLASSPDCGIAAGPLNLPSATGLSPGDVLFNDFFNGWIKFEPSSNQLFSLPWARQFGGNNGLELDRDGAILTTDIRNSVLRIHPVTGAATPITPIPSSTTGFEVLLDGDFLFYGATGSASRNGDIWTGGRNNLFVRYDRDAQTISPLPKPEQFVPGNVVIGHGGEVYVDEFFRGVQRIDLMTGEMTNNPQTNLGFRELLGVFPNGDLAVYSVFDGIGRLNLATGSQTWVSDRLFPLREAAMDEDGNFWAVVQSSLLLVNGETGEVSERLPNTSFFSPRSMLVIPSDWTPPPVPEPSTTALVLFAIVGVGLSNSRSRMC